MSKDERQQQQQQQQQQQAEESLENSKEWESLKRQLPTEKTEEHNKKPDEK